MKETRLINRFSEKIIIWGNGPFWAQKLCILITLDPLEKKIKNFSNKFPKKNLFGANGPF